MLSDLVRYETPSIAPKAVFEQLDKRRSRPRFMVESPSGDWQAITWDAFARDIRRITSFLANGILRPNESAAIFAPNSVAWITAALSIQAAGGCMIPIYPASLAPQALYVLDHSDTTVLFVDSAELFRRILQVFGKLDKVRRIVLLSDDINVPLVLSELRVEERGAPSLLNVEDKIVTWSTALQDGSSIDEEQPERFQTVMDAVELDQRAVMLYTSGTTGNPKGVPLTHRNVAANGIDWLRCNAPVLEEGAVDLMWLPMSHVFGFGEACIGNSLGWTSYLCDPKSVLSLLPTVRPNVFMSVPAYWEKLAQAAMTAPTPDAERAKLKAVTGGGLSFCLSGGAGLKREVKELFYRSGLLIIEGYGLSECSPTLTLNRPDQFRFDSVGKPLPSVQLKLAADGEILAKGPNVFAGYHKDPESTAAAFDSEGWFCTGDVGRFTEDGFLQIIDRKKEILVTAGGKNIPPANIECQFADEALIEHAVVYGDGKKFLVAGIWLNHEAVDAELGRMEIAEGPDRDKAQDDLVAAIVLRVNERLAKFEQIKKYAIVGKPLTVAGGHLTSTLKLRRKKIYQSFSATFEALY